MSAIGDVITVIDDRSGNWCIQGETGIEEEYAGRCDIKYVQKDFADYLSFHCKTLIDLIEAYMVEGDETPPEVLFAEDFIQRYEAARDST